MKHIKKFQAETAYTEFARTIMVRPNVSWVVNEDIVHYTEDNGMGDYYMKGEVDYLLSELSNRATEISISQNLDISAMSGHAVTFASKTIPTKISQLQNDREWLTQADISQYITGVTETDPTVPSWAKTANKPTYTAANVGALASNTTLDGIPDGNTRKLSNYVVKDGSKGLTTNDYTTNEKNKLGNIATSAQVNVIETVKRNGTELPSYDVYTFYLTGDISNTDRPFYIVVKKNGTIVDTYTIYYDRSYEMWKSAANFEVLVLPSGPAVAVGNGYGFSAGEFPSVTNNTLVGSKNVSTKTVDVTIPTKISQVTNNSGFINSSTTKDFVTTGLVKTQIESYGYTNKTGTITGVQMNGSSKVSNGVANLGTVVQSLKVNDSAATVSNGVASLTIIIPTGLPEVSPSDNGKVLKVVNGSIIAAYNKPDYTKIPFTVEALGSGSISWSLGNKTVQYSKNGGSWETMTKNTPIYVVQGDEVQFKGTNTNYNGNKFSSTVQFNVKGNIMSLLHGDEYTSLTTITSRAFAELFRNETEIISAKNLILPSTTLESHCYYNMFNGCTNLIDPPELPATTLAQSCYSGMFCGCSNLNTAPDLIALTLVESCYDSMFMNCSKINYIKAMFTTEPSWFTVNCWLDGTSSSGTFVKNSAAQWEVFGQDGIPTGWTVQTATS